LAAPGDTRTVPEGFLNPVVNPGDAVSELEEAGQYLFTVQEVVDYYQLRAADDIQHYDPQQPFRYSTVRLGDTVMDVEGLDRAQQGRLLGLFPRAVGYHQWKAGDTPSAPPVLRPMSIDDDS